MSQSIARRSFVELVASYTPTWPPVSSHASRSSAATRATCVRDATAAALSAEKNAASHAEPTNSRRYLPTLKWRVSWPSHVKYRTSLWAVNDLPRAGSPTSTMTSRRRSAAVPAAADTNDTAEASSTPLTVLDAISRWRPAREGLRWMGARAPLTVDAMDGRCSADGAAEGAREEEEPWEVG